MRLFLSTLLLMIPLFAEVPKSDHRNAEQPNTDTHFQPRGYTSAEWEARRAELKQRILFASGLHPMPSKTPLNPMVIQAVEGPDYVIEKVYLETLPGMYLGGNLYRPKNPSGKLPAILHPHGHWTYGRLENQPLYSAPTLGINLARNGFVVFAYDMVGYNDTFQFVHRFTGKTEQLWQYTPLGLQTWNSIRVLDFLETLPYVDTAKFGISGASGGGTQTFILAAIDDRIAATAPVNMVSLIMQGGCICENAPHLRVGTQNVEIAALAAPRPQLMVSATGDWTRNMLKEEFPAVQQLYALQGAKDKVEAVQFDAPHNYHKPSREAVYTFFHKVFQGGTQPVAERGASVPDARDLLVLWNRPAPDNAKPFSQLFADWRDMSQAQATAITDLATLRKNLGMAVEARLPDRVETTTEGALTVISRGEGDRVPIHLRKGSASSKEAWILIHPEGGAQAMSDAALTGKVATGATVYAPDVYLTGTAKATPKERHTHHATFNLTDDAQRVADILSAVAYARQQGATKVHLEASGKAAAWAILAAAMAPEAVTIAPPALSAHPYWKYDEWLAENCFIPGLQRAGGIPSALRILGAPAK